LIVFLAIALFAVPLIGVFRLDKRLHARHPDTRPFKWGYWMGMMCFLAPLFALGNTDGNTGAFIGASLIYVPVGVFVLLRHRWALITATVLSLNPIIWLANSIYIRNRWREMGAPARAPQRSGGCEAPPPAPPPQPPRFYVHLDNEVKGPFTMHQLEALREAKTISAATLCCRPGTQQWTSFELIQSSRA
jgi:hypothetical protein